jgi:ABC-type transport system substrate-binding protein
MNKRLVSLGFASLAFLMVLSLLPTTVAAVDVNQTEEVVIFAMPYDFGEYSLYTANSYATAQWVSSVYSGLVKRSSANNRGWVADAAAAMPTVSADGLTFTFELRDNLYFSNGEPLTVEDVEFSMKVALAPAIDVSGYSGYVNFLDNNSMNIISSNTFSITILQSFAFPYGLMSFGLIPQETFGERYENCINGVAADCTWNSPDGSDAISSGPFMVTDIDNTNEIVTVEANPYWWDASTVKTDKIIFQKIAEKNAAISALSDGSIHIMDSQYVPGLNELKGISGITEAFVGDPATQEISINNYNEWFGTGEAINEMNGGTGGNFTAANLLRRAMSHIVDRDTYVNEIMDGLAQVAATNMPSASLGWDPTILPENYSVAEAKTIMESLGFDFGSLGTPDATTGAYPNSFFEITVLSPNTNPARNQWSADYVQQLPKIGIGVKQHVSTGWAEIIPRTFGSSVNPLSYEEGGFDIFFVGYSWALDWNPSGLYDSSGACTGGSCSNFYNFDLEETQTDIAAHIQDYLTELDFDARLEKARTIQLDIHNYLPVLAILYPQSHWGWASDVTGIDSLLISVSSQEWDQVYRTGFVNNVGTVPGGEPTSKGGSDSPLSTTVFVAGLFSSAIAVFTIRKRKY